MVDLVCYLINLLCFLVFHCYFNLRSSIISCLFSGDMYIYFGISLLNPIFSVSLSTVSELLYDEVIVSFVIALAFLLLIKLPVAFAVFNYFF